MNVARARQVDIELSVSASRIVASKLEAVVVARWRGNFQYPRVGSLPRNLRRLRLRISVLCFQYPRVGSLPRN